MSRNYLFAPGEYYHIYARGVEKLSVYREDGDYRRFIECLYLLNTKKQINIRDVKKEFSRGLTSGEPGDIYTIDRGETLVDIGAYCLMPNHFHILVHEKDLEGKGISKFMQKLLTSYTMYFNKKNERTGALFGSAFKARHVTDDIHLKYLFSYIHLNPREIGKHINVKEYMYSSYMDYINSSRSQEKIVNKTPFPEYFSEGHENEINEWLEYNSILGQT